MDLGFSSLDAQARTHARARRRSALILIGAFWAFAILMLSIRAMFIDSLPIHIIGPRRLLAAAIGALLCLAMAQVLEALRRRSFSERIAWGVVGAFVMAITLTSATMILNRVVLPLPGAAPISVAESAQWVLVWLGYLLAWTGTHLALTYHWESEDHRQRAAMLADMTKAARMAALRYQLNPHFLFNALNSISSLVGEGRGAEAETMLLNLSAFVRSSLTDEPAGAIPLSEEIALQRLYLEIEQVRFAERLRVEIDLPPALEAVRVPALILQPLVENAIRHGLGRSEAPLTVRIAAAEQAEAIEILVEDDGRAGDGDPSAGSGLGLRNVRARLEAHFGAAASLTAGPQSGGGFRCAIVLPRSPA